MLHTHNTGDCGGHCLIEIIRARAHQIYEARGRESGHDLSDWLQAEHELKQHLGFEPLCNHPPEPSC